MYNPLNAAIQIKQALNADDLKKVTRGKYVTRCQCCGKQFRSDYFNGTDAVCPECGWEQQYKTIKYTGQNPVGIRMYRFLLKFMKGSI